MSLLKNLLVDRLGRRDDTFGWRVLETALPADEVRTLCVLHTDAKLGDAIVNSLLVDGLQKARPKIEVTVGTTAGFEAYWRAHPGVRNVLVLPDRDRLGNPLAKLRDSRAAAAPWKGRFDALVSFDSYAFFDTFALINALEPKRAIGFNKQAYRLFDVSLDDGRHGLQRSHISGRVEWTLRALGIELPLSDLRVHLPFGEAEAAEAADVVERAAKPGPRLLLNVYGASPDRTLTPATAAEVLRTLDWSGPVFLSVPAGRQAEFAAVAADAVVVPPLSGFAALFALVARMDAVVSPDTGVVHIAAGLDKPQLSLFRDRTYNPIVWRPMGERAEVVLSTTGENVNDLDRPALAAAAARLRAR